MLSITISKGFSKDNISAIRALRKKIYSKDSNAQHLIENVDVLPSKHYFERAEAELFVAYRNHVAVGSVVTYADPEASRHVELSGFFNHFESIDDDNVIIALNQEIQAWFSDKNVQLILGPMSPVLKDTRGILISKKLPPIFGMSYNPAYYQRLFEKNGWTKKKDLNELQITLPIDREKIEKISIFAQSRVDGLTVRNLNLSDIENDIEIIVNFYNKTWKDNWGFIPLNKSEFIESMQSIKSILRPEYGTILEIDGNCVGFCLIVPDLNQVINRCASGIKKLFKKQFFPYLLNRVKQYRAMFIGVDSKYRGLGFEAILFQSVKNIEADSFHVGWVLEDNMALKKSNEKFKWKRA